MAETRSRRLKQSRSNASVRDCVVKLQSENEIKRLISQKEDNTHKLNIGIKMHDNKMFVGNKILESDNDTFNLQLKLTSNGISICETAKPNYSVPQVVPIRNLRPRLNSGSVTSCLLSKAESISVVTPNMYLSSKNIANRWFLTKTGEIVQFNYATIAHNSYLISGTPVKDKRDFFILPYSSSKSDIFISNGTKSNEKMFHVSDLKAKFMCVSYHDEFVFIPLLHTIDELEDYCLK